MPYSHGRVRENFGAGAQDAKGCAGFDSVAPIGEAVARELETQRANKLTALTAGNQSARQTADDKTCEMKKTLYPLCAQRTRAQATSVAAKLEHSISRQLPITRQ